jgi:hypothetical protein
MKKILRITLKTIFYVAVLGAILFFYIVISAGTGNTLLPNTHFAFRMLLGLIVAGLGISLACVVLMAICSGIFSFIVWLNDEE